MRAEVSHEQTVNLPGGLVEEDGRCARIAVLRPLSGREEEWMAQHACTPNATRVTRLLTSCLCSLDDRPVTAGTAGRLLLGDRDFLMLQLRRLTLGDSIWAVFECPSCRKDMDINLILGEIPIASRPQEQSSHAVVLSRRGTERTIRFRLPIGTDQETILGLSLESAVDTMLDACVLDDGGLELNADERVLVGDVMADLAPDVSLELDLVCPECDHAFVAEFDTTAFFLDEMSVRGDQLLREVHSLALSYHWSESEILGLVHERRRAYLSLLSESMRED